MDHLPFEGADILLSLDDDFTRLAAQSREQPQQHVQKLDAAGETIAAIDLALYGFDLTTAKRFVEGLRKNA